MKEYRLNVTEDDLRVIANCCSLEANIMTRDGRIARQIAQTIKSVLMPGTPKPMKMADVPLPTVEVIF